MIRPILALVLLAAAARAEDPPVTFIEVGAQHGDMADSGSEAIRVRVKDGKATVEVEVDGRGGADKVEKDAAEITKAQMESLARLIRGRGLLQWGSPPPAAPDWGTERYVIDAKVRHEASWSGPMNSSAPPIALLRAMGDLAHALVPKVHLSWLLGTSPATARVRFLAFDGGPGGVMPFNAPAAEIEVVARADSWKIFVRSGGLEESSELAKEDWEALVKALADTKVAEWDEKTALRGPDCGWFGIEMDLETGYALKSNWLGNEHPGGKAAEAIRELAKKKGLVPAR